MHVYGESAMQYMVKNYTGPFKTRIWGRRDQLIFPLGEAARVSINIQLVSFCIDGQVRLVYVVRLQTDNIRLSFCQETVKRQTSVCTMSTW